MYKEMKKSYLIISVILIGLAFMISLTEPVLLKSFLCGLCGLVLSGIVVLVIQRRIRTKDF